MILLGLSFALCLYSGDSTYYDLSNKIENLQNFTCNITAENYDLEGLNFTTNDTGFIISTQIDYMPDNLTIDCLLNGLKYVEVSSGSGSSSVSENKIENGYQNQLKENAYVKFQLSGNKITFKVKNIYDNSTKFSIKSEEKRGESKII